MTRAAYILAALLFAAPALGQYPQTCGPIPSLFQAVAKGTRWTADMHNELLCILNALQSRTVTEGRIETVCKPVTVPAGERQLVNFALGSDVAGTEPTFASVSDPTNPARLMADGIQGITGQLGTAWVWNTDTVNQRTGTACLQVVRVGQ